MALVYTFTKKEESSANLLIEAGLVRHSARTLVFLANIPEATSRDIERGTDLRQGEVSKAISYFTGRGWVESRKLAQEKRGRSMCIYRLVVPLSEILSAIEQDMRDEMEQKIALIRKVRAMG